MDMSPELSAEVQRRIDELDPARADAPRARVCKENLNALPLYYDEHIVWALRPDGILLRLGREATGHPPSPETDPAQVSQVLVWGARRYPELLELVPDAPAAEVDALPVAMPPSVDIDREPVSEPDSEIT